MFAYNTLKLVRIHRMHQISRQTTVGQILLVFAYIAPDLTTMNKFLRKIAGTHKVSGYCSMVFVFGCLRTVHWN